MSVLDGIRILSKFRIRRSPIRAIPLGVSLISLSIFSLLIIAACNGGSPTETPSPTRFPTTIPPTATVAPTSTPVVVPTATPTLTPLPTATPTRAPTPTPTLVPSPTPTPTPTSIPAPPPVPEAIQPRELLLDISSLEDNRIVRSPEIILEGQASPDATVSVNGQMLDQDNSGQFRANQYIPPLEEGPNLIEVIASDLAGEVRSEVMTVIFTPGEDGLFGRVTDITTSAPGIFGITVGTAEGEQPIETTPNTDVTIPGREPATAADISPGDFLAVMVSSATNDQEALSILVKPDRPVVHAHITGVVIDTSGDQTRIMDRYGNLITADLLPEEGQMESGEVVTAVLGQDLKAGSLSILASESADVKIARLSQALEMAVRSDNRENLGERLRASTTGHLTTLREVINRVDGDIQEGPTSAYEALLSRFDLGKSMLKLTGRIEDIDRDRGTVLVSPQEGPQIQLTLLDTTTIHLFGQAVRLQQLEIGQHKGQKMEAIYDPQTGEARTLSVISPALSDDLAASHLPQARLGELGGTVSRVDAIAVPPVVEVRLATGQSVNLNITPAARIRVREQPAGLTDLVQGVRVKVRYVPSTMNVLDIETFDLKQDEAFVSGVVKSLKKKLQDGNITITTLEGETIALNITSLSTLEREGMPINIVRVGDVVRPVSRYNTLTRDVQKLSVKAPELRGTVRGKYSTLGGSDYVTISTDQLNLVTVSVASGAELIKGNEIVRFEALAVGDRVVSGMYDPPSLRGSQLVIGPTRTLRATGTISALDEQFPIATMAPTVGESIKLLLPKSARITRDGNPQATFTDLEPGDVVRFVYYMPNGVVVRILVTSQ